LSYDWSTFRDAGQIAGFDQRCRLLEQGGGAVNTVGVDNECGAGRSSPARVMKPCASSNGHPSRRGRAILSFRDPENPILLTV
jgi:hypothetical protein